MFTYAFVFMFFGPMPYYRRIFTHACLAYALLLMHVLACAVLLLHFYLFIIGVCSVAYACLAHAVLLVQFFLTHCLAYAFCFCMLGLCIYASAVLEVLGVCTVED